MDAPGARFRSGDLRHRLPLARPEGRLPEGRKGAQGRGSLALFWNEHVHADADEGFFEDAQEVYEREAPEIVRPEDSKGLPRPDEVRDRTPEITGSGLFEDVTTRRYRWDETYDTTGYLRVLSTYSGHRGLSDDARERLFRGIAHLVEARYGGRVTKGYLTTLYVARRR